MNNLTTLPSYHLNDFRRGDILIQVLCNKSIAQWIVVDIKGGGKYHLQLIDSHGIFTNKIKVVNESAILNYIKDSIATKLMRSR